MPHDLRNILVLLFSSILIFAAYIAIGVLQTKLNRNERLWITSFFYLYAEAILSSCTDFYPSTLIPSFILLEVYSAIKQISSWHQLEKINTGVCLWTSWLEADDEVNGHSRNENNFSKPAGIVKYSEYSGSRFSGLILTDKHWTATDLEGGMFKFIEDRLINVFTVFGFILYAISQFSVLLCLLHSNSMYIQ